MMEILNPQLSSGRYQAAIFDFDGTLSLLREGWPQVMTEVLWDQWQAAGLPADEPLATCQSIEQLILSENGSPPLRQMELFASAVRERGGRPVDPHACLQIYRQRLATMLEARYAAVRQGGPAAAVYWTVPGTHRFLEVLQARGILTFVISGTDYDQVATEVEMLGLARYISGGLFAPHGNDANFTKFNVISNLQKQYGWSGEDLIGFGDGVIETQVLKSLGGTAIGVASHPAGTIATTPHPHKRQLLISAGADAVIPDYRDAEQLAAWLCGCP